MTWLVEAGIVVSFCLAWGVLFAGVAQLSRIADKLTLIDQRLDLMRAEFWQRHQQVHGSTGVVKDRDE